MKQLNLKIPTTFVAASFAVACLLAVSPALAQGEDTDMDGLSDDFEQTESFTDPNNPDTDGDGLSDGNEFNEYGTDPNEPDTDFGGVPDGAELEAGTDPRDPSDDEGGDGGDTPADAIAAYADCLDMMYWDTMELLGDEANAYAAKGLEKALKELEKAMEELDKGKLDEAIEKAAKAIDKLDKAWEKGGDTSDLIWMLLDCTEQAIDAIWMWADGTDQGKEAKHLEKAAEKREKSAEKRAEGKLKDAMKELAKAAKELEKLDYEAGPGDDDDDDNNNCTPSCEGAECGDDGCGGTCGVCADGASCNDGMCEGMSGGSCNPVEGTACETALGFECNGCMDPTCAVQCLQNGGAEGAALADCFVNAEISPEESCWTEAVGVCAQQFCPQEYAACIPPTCQDVFSCAQSCVLSAGGQTAIVQPGQILECGTQCQGQLSANMSADATCFTDELIGCVDDQTCVGSTAIDCLLAFHNGDICSGQYSACNQN